MNSRRITFEEELAANGKLVYTSVGYSMRPMLREGRDVIMIESIGSRTLKRYDVVLFRRPDIKGRGEYVLHRILRVMPNGNYWIVGDNCTSGEIVPQEDILGILTKVRRGGKKMLDVNDMSYRMYVTLWCNPYHVRIFLLRVSRFIKRLIKRLIKHK